MPYQNFTLEIAPIREETGRYERLPVSERICFHCRTCVEDELHVLVDCPLNNELRLKFFYKICRIMEYICKSGSQWHSSLSF